MAYQLPLQIRLNDAATFENYLAASNRELVAILQAAKEPYLYIWSEAVTGKSHLLQAACREQQQGRAIYLPLQELHAHPAQILEGLEQFALVSLDDIHLIAGHDEWEQQLFHLYNRLREQGGRLYVSAKSSPAGLNIKLKDLISRLNWGPVYQLQALEDMDKIRAMQLRAGQRGFELPDEVANYLLARYPRDLHSLFALLDKLDFASLQAQRRLTIPFVKSHLAES